MFFLTYTLVSHGLIGFHDGFTLCFLTNMLGLTRVELGFTRVEYCFTRVDMGFTMVELGVTIFS